MHQSPQDVTSRLGRVAPLVAIRRVAEGAGRVRPRDVARVVATQALFRAAVLAVINARRHRWALAALGVVIAAGFVGVVATLLLARDRS